MRVTPTKRSILLFVLMLLQLFSNALPSFATTPDTHPLQDIACETTTCHDACDQQDMIPDDPLFTAPQSHPVQLFTICPVHLNLPQKHLQPVYAIFVPP